MGCLGNGVLARKRERKAGRKKSPRPSTGGFVWLFSYVKPCDGCGYHSASHAASFCVSGFSWSIFCVSELVFFFLRIDFPHITLHPRANAWLKVLPLLATPKSTSQAYHSGPGVYCGSDCNYLKPASATAIHLTYSCLNVVFGVWSNHHVFTTRNVPSRDGLAS
jgi:hypothetical protein